MLALTFFSLTCATFVLGYMLGKRARPALTLGTVHGAVQLRVAVHEVGHALVGHHAPHIYVRRIEVDEGLSKGQGRVASAAARSPSEYTRERWWDAAYSLGGLAGELLELKKARSGNCWEDIQYARAAAQDIVGTEPPWSPMSTDTGGFDPVKTFKGGTLSDEEARVLRLAYAHARALLLRERDAFSRLTHTLLEQGSLDEAAIQKVLG